MPGKKTNVGLSKQKLLTVKEVADLMRVSVMTVYRLVKSGDIPSMRVGSSFRIAERDVEGYLASGYSGNGQGNSD